MNDKFLINQSMSTWLVAAENCKKMVDGLIDFEQIKMFVTTLHNAIEINLKQIMLDNNDHDILVKNYPTGFKSAIDLNGYFKNLSKSELTNLYTIQFSNLIPKFKTHIPNIVGKLTMSKKLKLINCKRNQTTHFYASEQDFLSETDFADLYDLAVCVCEYFKSKGLLKFWGTPNPDSEDELYNLHKLDRSSLTYNNLIINSQTNVSLLNQFNYIDEEIPGLFAGYCNSRDLSVYEMAKNVFFESEKETPWIITKLGFYEFYRRLNILIAHKLLKINFIIEEDEDESGNIRNSYYFFICKN